MKETRYYKGKYPVEVVKKSKGNWLVKALCKIPRISFKITHMVTNESDYYIMEGELFTTVPRLLWRNPRKRK